MLAYGLHNEHVDWIEFYWIGLPYLLMNVGHVCMVQIIAEESRRCGHRVERCSMLH